MPLARHGGFLITNRDWGGWGGGATHRHVGVLEEGVGREHAVVRLDDRGRDLRRRVDGERQLGLAAVVDREALEEQGAEAGAGATADGVEEEETLEAGAIVGELRGGGGKRTRGRGEAREKARGRSGAIDKRGRGISNERCSWGAGRVGRAPCGCGRGRGRRSPCRWCSGRGRSCWRRPPCRRSAAPGGRAGGRCPCAPRRSPGEWDGRRGERARMGGRSGAGFAPRALTVGSRSTKTVRGTCLPEPVSEKKVLNASSPPPMVLSEGICPSGWIPCSRQYSSQHALPACTPH